MDGQTHMSCADFGRYLEQFGAKMTRQAVSKSLVIPKDKVGAKTMVPVAKALRALAGSGRISLDTAGLEADANERPEQATGRPRAASGGGGGYYDEKAQTEIVVRQLRELELEERQGKLVRVDEVTDALADAGRRIGEQIDQLRGWSPELVAAAEQGGEAAVRQFMRERTRALRASIVDALTQAMGVPDGDE